MKVLHLLIIMISCMILCFTTYTAYALYGHSNLDIETTSDTSITQLAFNNSIITFEQYLNKTTYKTGETIYIYGQLRNVGTHDVYVSYLGPATSSVLKDQNGKLMDSFGGAYVLDGGPYGNATLYPNSTTTLSVWDFPRTIVGGGPWSLQIQPAVLTADEPGTYYIRSMIDFHYRADLNSEQSKEVTLWSKPLQITVLPETYVQNKQPIEITQVELDSPLAFFPNNQTCSSEFGFDTQHSCLTNLIPGKKVQCAYFIGSSTCEPIHQDTGGTSHSCLDFNEVPKAPQWFDMYNTQNKTIQIQLFNVQTFQNMKPWGYESYVPMPITLGPNEKCTYDFGPVDEPLALEQTNTSFVVSYSYNGKNYTTTTPPMTDTYNDTLTWQFDTEKWIFSQQNTVKVPEFSFAVPVLLISSVLSIVFYRIKFRK